MKVTSLLASEFVFYAFSYNIGFRLTADKESGMTYHFVSFHWFLFAIYFAIPWVKFLWTYERFYIFLSHWFAISVHTIKGIILLASEHLKIPKSMQSEITMLVFAGMALLFMAAIVWDLGVWFDFEDPSFDFITFSSIERVNKEILEKRRKRLFELLPCIKLIKELYAEYETCSIWLRNYIESEIIKILPNWYHLFHIECIRNWFLKTNICPYCRSKSTYDDVWKISNMTESELISKLRKRRGI